MGYFRSSKSLRGLWQGKRGQESSHFSSFVSLPSVGYYTNGLRWSQKGGP
jgi:hypothetical protein